MSKVEIDTERGNIIINGMGSMIHDYDSFYKALSKAMKNDSDYSFEQAGVKHYRVGQTDTALAIIPQPKGNRIKNKEKIRDHKKLSVILRVENPSKSNYFFMRNIEFVDLIELSEQYTPEDLLEGVIEYPKVWSEEENYIFLNEALKIEKERFRDAIVGVLTNGKNHYEFEIGNDKYTLISRENESENTKCNICKDVKQVIFIKESKNLKKIPRSSICLECLPDFMCQYLDMSKEQVTGILVSRKI